MLQGDMKKARKLLTKSYKEGNERAASYMATSYLMEDSTDVGVGKAMKWLLKVPDDSLSVRMLCELYNDSNSIFFDKAKGDEYLFRAADMGDPRALFFTGRAYLNGERGVEIDRAKAMTCFQMAAQKREPNACYVVVVCSFEYGIPDDETYEKLYRYACYADSMGIIDARKYIGLMKCMGKGTEYDPVRAAVLLSPFANAGDPLAMTTLGNLFLEGEGVQKDRGKALKYFKEAAAMDYVDAYYSLAMYYRCGKDRDIELAEKYAKRCYESCPDEYMYRRGYAMILMDEFRSFDVEKENYLTDYKVDSVLVDSLLLPGIALNELYALDYFVKRYISKERFTEAYDLAARIRYHKGVDDEMLGNSNRQLVMRAMINKPTPQNISFIKDRADRGDVVAQRVLGSYYYRKKKYKLAQHYYKLAIEQGDSAAKTELKYMEDVIKNM